jgi:hypothetical protein
MSPSSGFKEATYDSSTPVPTRERREKDKVLERESSILAFIR